MNQSIFSSFSGLDNAYLDEAYANDADMASMVFEQYLAEFPANYNLLIQSYNASDVEQFRHHMHKQKPGFSYVGLTDVTKTFTEMQEKCITVADLRKFKPELDAVLERIRSSAPLIEKILAHLQQLQRA